jgi:hypothetical protein
LVFESLAAMLSAAGLSRIAGGEVTAVTRSPLDRAHFSGNTLEQVIAELPGGSRRFVLKRFAIERDWIMRLTHDHAVREAALFRHGVYARLPAVCYVPVVAVARDGNSWASLMDDVSAGLTQSVAVLPAADLRRYLRHLAAVHARFLNDDTLRDAALGLSSLRDFVQILAERTARAEIAAERSHPVLELALRGWQIFAEIAPPEVVGTVAALADDPQPLLALLERGPHTLIHGDYKTANLGSWPAGAFTQAHTASAATQTIMLDWQDASYGPGLLDLGYFLAISGTRLPIAKESAIGIYRTALAEAGYRYTNHAWERDLELGLLAGGALRLLWQKALATQSPDPSEREAQMAELRWWSDVVLRARRWLS